MRAIHFRTGLFALVALLATCAPEPRRTRRTPPSRDIGSMPPPMEMQDLEQQRPINYNPPEHRQLNPEYQEKQSASDPTWIR